MNRVAAIAVAFLGTTLPLTAFAVIPPQDDPGIKVKPVVQIKAYPFDLSAVRLLEGSPFKHAQDLDAKYLLALDADRLLAGFRSEAGLPKKAEKYPSWESAGVAGFTLGHYLSAVSMMYASTGDERFKLKADYVVTELAECQKANGDGFIAAFPNSKKIFAQIAAGDIRSNGAADLNGGWVPWYTLHKDMAGLRDAYLYCKNEQARTVLIGMADWTGGLLGKLTDAQVQEMLRTEQGGMNEVLADVYSITGDKKYLALAERFNHQAILGPLMAGKDPLTGRHANTQIPKVIGLAREYEMTGDPKDAAGAEFFWDDVTGKRSFANGGNSNGEAFFPLGQMQNNLGISASETCNTYNMLKLTRHLFAWNPDAKYADYYERALYNHILASQDPITGGMTYYVSMQPGTFKTFSSPFDSFWCCVGTGMENHAKYGGEIFYHNDDTLWVNLYIRSELDWSDRGLKVKLETNYPQDGKVKVTVTAAQPTRATLMLRIPSWTKKFEDLQVTVHTPPAREPKQGKLTMNLGKDGYFLFGKTWSGTESIAFTIPMGIRTEPMPDDPSKVAFFYGPTLLAADIGNKDVPEPIATGDQLMYARRPAAAVPVLVTDNKPVTDWTEPVDGQPMTFKTVGVGKPNDVTLVPFYLANRMRYSVYLDTYTPDQWTKKQADIEAAAKAEAALAARTIDSVDPSQQQPEHDHDCQSANSFTGTHQGRGWRDARPPKGFISYQLKVDPAAATDLVCTFWGGETGDRNFDITVDGVVIGTQRLNQNKPGEFFDAAYAIPAGQTKGKSSVTVRFVSRDGGMIGGLFGVRTVKR
jgi:DUF1680 family protein